MDFRQCSLQKCSSSRLCPSHIRIPVEQDSIPACVVVVVVVVRSLVNDVKVVCSIMLLSSGDIAISAQLTNISGRYPGELPTKSQSNFS